MAKLNIAHIVKGQLVEGSEVEHGALITPGTSTPSCGSGESHSRLRTWIRMKRIDLLVEVGSPLDPATNPWLGEAMAWAGQSRSPYPRLVESRIADSRDSSRRISQVSGRDRARLVPADGMVGHSRPLGGSHHVPAFPPRLVHVVSGTRREPQP